MINANDKKFSLGVKNIAILFYGQYRTGDVLMPYFKEFLKSTYDVNIDVFVSIKTENDYPNHRSSSINDRNIDQDVDTIRRNLSPKNLNVLFTSNEKEVVNTHRLDSIRFFTSLIDANRMKQLYENDNNIIYDIVLPLRFDLYVKPLYLIDCIVWWHNNVTHCEYSEIFLSHNPMYMAMERVPGIINGFNVFKPGVQDLLFWGNSLAMDIVMSNLLRVPSFVHPYTENPDTQPGFQQPWVSNANPHFMLYDAVVSSNINISNVMPVISTPTAPERGMYIPSFRHQPRRSVMPTQHIEYTPVRESVDQNLCPFHEDTFEQWRMHFEKYG